MCLCVRLSCLHCEAGLDLLSHCASLFLSPPHRLPVPRSLVIVGSEGMATQPLTDEALVSHVIFSHSLPEAQAQRVGLFVQG